MNYRSVAQLSDQVLQWSAKLPHQLDLIVGIPRSGLLVGNLLALYRNLPLTDVDGLIEGRLIAAGRRRLRGHANTRSGALRVLVVDDSLRTGDSLRAVRERIGAAGLPHKIQYGAVYVLTGAEQHVDFCCERLEDPRMFEWNIMHHDRLGRTCMDLDGVLCRDPMLAETDDGAGYRGFISGVPPLHLPSVKVGWLVSTRLEKYRGETETWLKAHGVCFGELVMLDAPDKQTRMATISESGYKAEVYRRTGAELFIESSLNQSLQIANLALKPVFCVDTMQMIYPGTRPSDRYTPPPSSSMLRSLRLVRRQLRQSIARYRGKILGSSAQ